MPSYTTTDFLDAVKIRGAIPTSQNTFTVDRLLNFGDQEIRTYFLPLIMSAREYYYAYDDERALNATGIYDISSRAVGGKLINAALIQGTSRLDLNWITEDELTRTDTPNRGRPGIYIKRNQLILIPPAPGFTTLRMTIPIRPGKMVATSSAAQITAINTATNTLTFVSGTIPTAWTTAMTFDLVQDQPHFDTLSIDLTSSAITTTTMQLSSLSSRLAVGDWVSKANESPIIQIPAELHGCLFQACANTCLRSQGHMDALVAGERELAEMRKNAHNIYNDRIEQEGKKIILRNRSLRRL